MIESLSSVWFRSNMSSDRIVDVFPFTLLFLMKRLFTGRLVYLLPLQYHDRSEFDVVENAPGKYCVIRGRKQGKQEQMIPIFASQELQVAAGGLSYVGSREFDIATSEWSLSIDTKHPLKP